MKEKKEKKMFLHATGKQNTYVCEDVGAQRDDFYTWPEAGFDRIVTV